MRCVFEKLFNKCKKLALPLTARERPIRAGHQMRSFDDLVPSFGKELFLDFVHFCVFQISVKISFPQVL